MSGLTAATAAAVCRSRAKRGRRQISGQYNIIYIVSLGRWAAGTNFRVIVIIVIEHVATRVKVSYPTHSEIQTARSYIIIIIIYIIL